jgi:3D-(3,5/4)-trihydroxycyclohexane-1,2-dione acylhydrolase (decyclizing)
MVVSDARAALVALTAALGDYRVPDSYSQRVGVLVADWAKVTDECFHRNNQPLPAQTEVFGALNELMGDDDIVINAAGSMPGDLQALWRARTPRQYHLEYGYSCMGYEIPAAMGAKLAAPDSEVVAIVGDGSYQMLPQEIATIVSENLKVIIVLLQNHGFASIGGLSESRGSQRFGTKYRMRGESSDRLDGAKVPLDLAGSARSFGADVLEVHTIEEFRDAYKVAAASTRTTLIYIETDLYGPNPPASAWWDVPVSQTSRLGSTQQAHIEYLQHKLDQRHHL